MVRIPWMRNENLDGENSMNENLDGKNSMDEN